MRKITTILLLLFWKIGFGQNQEIKSNLPTVIPPSPTVAALMKFEEVPVNNYTGIPDISIPLFSTVTHSKDINLDISLKYHPAGVAANERASDVGLCWSLFAGGTISRTVRGLPDELYDVQGVISSGNGKIGIYNNTTLHKNNYNEIVDLYNNGSLLTNDVMNKFLWNNTERSLYDNEFDLWQFNFMGHSGQFIIKKNTINNNLEIANLDLNSGLKIINIYNTSSYVPIAFHIYDTHGNQFIFDVTEVTISNSTTTTSHYGTNDVGTNVTKDVKFISAFHLSKILDNNGKDLLQIEYNNDNNRLEIAQETSTTDNVLNPNFMLNVDVVNANAPEQLTIIDPKYIGSINQRRVTTKKITKIIVEGHCKIDFNFIKGRLDSNLYHADSSYVFKGIVANDWKGTNIKKIELEHKYSGVIDNRMILSKVKNKNFDGNKETVYTLEYRENGNPNGYGSITKDLWGYFKIPNFFGFTDREVNPDFCTTDLLQKMVLPSGGCVVFDFEPNTYSHIRDISQTNFDDNPKNFDEQILTTPPFTAVNNQIKSIFFTIQNTQDVYLTSVVNTNNLAIFRDYSFDIYKSDGNNDIPVQSLGCYSCGNYNQDVMLKNLTPGTYKVSFNTVDLQLRNELINAWVTAHFKIKNANNYQFSYGGGNRISKIGYFKDNVEKNIYQSTTNVLPDKEKIYSYNFFNEPNKSSGSLVLDKPIFEYDFMSSHYFYKSQNLEAIWQAIFEFKFTKKTDYNNIKTIKTGGADIGYQNVTVKEEKNGTTQFVYTSPIDIPENIALINSYPFYPPYNEDYKRGLLKEEIRFDNFRKKISQTNYGYTIDEIPFENTVYGLSTNYFSMDNHPFSRFFSEYSKLRDGYNWLQSIILCANQISFDYTLSLGLHCQFKSYIKLPREYIDISLLHTANGWAKLTSKTTSNYFYPSGSSTPNVVTTKETFSYHTSNKQIASHIVENSFGDVLTTNYFYHTGNSPFSQNRISEIERIETKKGTELLSESKINYSNTFGGNQSFLPSTIEVKKGLFPSEVRLKNNIYDELGHVLEVEQVSGVKICYIYGYNNTQPIAKIENATYSSLQSQATNLQTVSNSGTEENLITALNNLRTSLPNALVTTYTYKPLIGVSTITDPKGDKITYSYDSFGRLQSVTDKDGNVLSENQYNYKQ